MFLFAQKVLSSEGGQPSRIQPREVGFTGGYQDLRQEKKSKLWWNLQSVFLHTFTTTLFITWPVVSTRGQLDIKSSQRDHELKIANSFNTHTDVCYLPQMHDSSISTHLSAIIRQDKSGLSASSHLFSSVTWTCHTLTHYVDWCYLFTFYTYDR